MLNLLFSGRHVITSHYLNKNDTCSRFSLNINNLEISILQILLLKMRVNIIVVGENKQTGIIDHFFFKSSIIKSSYNKCLKFIKRRKKMMRK